MPTLSADLFEEYLRIPSTSPLLDMIRLLMQTGLKLLDADEGSLLVVDPRLGDLRFVMTFGNESSGSMIIGQRVPVGTGITGLAAATREVQVGAPIYRDLKQSERLDGSAPEAVVAAPMLLGDRLLGVLTAVSFQSGRRFDSAAARTFGAFAVIAAFMIDQEQRLMSAGIATPPKLPGGSNIEASLAAIARERPDAMTDVASVLHSLQKLAARP